MSKRYGLRRAWHGLLGAGPLLLLVALLPASLYVDHWSEYARLGTQDTRGALAEQSRHANHCHIGPANCSEQPTAGHVPVFPRVVELGEPDLPAVFIEESPPTPEEFIAVPASEPPRF